jgi:Fe-S-cluster containining protein
MLAKFDESVSKEEQEKIKAVGIEFFEGRCSCAIYADRPKMCKDGPIATTRMPYCGYYFDMNGNRYGECNRCGRCCALPRKKGNPYGVYDPKGFPCEHLVVK